MLAARLFACDLVITIFHLKFKLAVLNFIPIDLSCDDSFNGIVFAHGYGSTFELTITEKTYFHQVSAHYLRVCHCSVITNTWPVVARSSGLLSLSLVRLCLASYLLSKHKSTNTSANRWVKHHRRLFARHAGLLLSYSIYDTPNLFVNGNAFMRYCNQRWYSA